MEKKIKISCIKMSIISYALSSMYSMYSIIILRRLIVVTSSQSLPCVETTAIPGREKRYENLCVIKLKV